MRHLKTLFKLPLYLIFLLTFFIAALPARAFEISPVKSLFTVDPGTTQTIIVKIKNTLPFIPPLKGEGQGVGFKLNVLGMMQDEDGRPIFARGIDAAESWVYPENNLVNIKSGETKSVNFIIKIPTDAVAGSYYLGLAVEPVLEKGGQTSLATRLVSLLTLEVKGLVQESVIIEKWEPSARLGEQNDLEIKKLKFDLGLKNNGTIEVLMHGQIAIRNWKGEEIFSEPIILGNKLLAGSKRALHPEIILRNDINLSTGQAGLPGLYSAQVKINYGRTNQIVSAISYVWYFPRWSKIVLGVIILILVFLIFWRIRKVRR
jgi:hypothetical protein